MSGRNRLPNGEPRRASQRRTRPAAPKLIQVGRSPGAPPTRCAGGTGPASTAVIPETVIMSRSSSPNASTACAGPSCGRGEARDMLVG